MKKYFEVKCEHWLSYYFTSPISETPEIEKDEGGRIPNDVEVKEGPVWEIGCRFLIWFWGFGGVGGYGRDCGRFFDKSRKEGREVRKWLSVRGVTL